jgi:acetate kinase
VDLSGAKRILTINGGSSSLKLALYEMDRRENLIFSAQVNRIGEASSCISITEAGAWRDIKAEVNCRDQDKALEAALKSLEERQFEKPLHAISHRIVHGGSRHAAPQRITSQFIGELRELVSIDPDHLPQSIKKYRSCSPKVCRRTSSGLFRYRLSPNASSKGSALPASRAVF